MKRKGLLAILGAGPAGLAAAAATRHLRSVVFEAGPRLTERSQDAALSSASGVGGAGLYSDGKFSFWPSASNLWKLNPRLLLNASSNLSSLLQEAPFDVPDSRQIPIGDPALNRTTKGFKHYPSYYLSPEHRHALIQALANRAYELIRRRSTTSGLNQTIHGYWGLEMKRLRRAA